MDSVLVLCKCGCGNLRTKLDKKGRGRYFIKGHQVRLENPSKNPLTREKISRAIKSLGIRGEKHPQYKKPTNLICLNCDKSFLVPVRRKIKAKFCNIQCRREWMSLHYRGSGNPSWKHELVRIICRYCKKTNTVSYFRKDTAGFCNYNCRGKYYSGIRHHNYVNGESHLPYPREFSRKFKRKIYTLFGKKCYHPEKDNCHGVLSIHHIDYDKNNLNFNNLIPLCIGHNSSVNIRRDHWMGYFKSIIGNRVVLPHG